MKQRLNYASYGPVPGAIGLAAVLSALVILVALLLGGLGPAAWERTAITLTLNVILVVGIYCFSGTSGVLSFGYLAFAAIGAYSSSLLAIPSDSKEFLFPELPAWLVSMHTGALVAVLIGAAAAAVVALVLAVPMMRLSGLGASLATFVVLLIVHDVAQNWSSITQGTAGLTAVPTNTTIGVALAAAVAVIVTVALFQVSRFGLMLRSSRDSVPASRALGVRVERERTIAFVLSAFIAGMGGALYAQYLGSFSPETFYLSLTFLTIVMLIVGGLNSLSGAVIGAVLVSLLSEVLRRAEAGFALGPIQVPDVVGLQELGFAVALLVILALRPSGLTGGRELRMSKALRGRLARGRLVARNETR